MVPPELLQSVKAQVRDHCAAKGYVSGPNWNPMVPRDSVAAFAMARRLVESGDFDAYVAVAPEGHVYGYFFERLGVRMLSVMVEYPPRGVELGEGLETLREARVLLLEDDVVSGVTLKMVVDALSRFGPRSLCVYLGLSKAGQQLENIPEGVERVYLAEDDLAPAERERHEADFMEQFRPLLGS